MDIRVLNGNYTAIGILDTIESFIWKECYNKTGEFEIYNKFSPELLDLLQEDYYLQIPESTRTMIIESIEIDTKPEEGDKLIVRGRSIDSILDRRIILKQTQINANFDVAVSTLIDQNAISSIYPERNIPGLSYIASSDPGITGINVKAQFYSENLLETIESLCQQADVGFKMLIDSSNEFAFNLYLGSDRSYNQSTNPYVIFSPEFDNLVNSKYYQSKRTKKNYALITGNSPSAWPGYPFRQQVWTSDVGTGLGRREMAVDAKDIPLYVLDSSTQIPDADYMAQLAQRGYEALAENTELTIFDGQIRVNFGGSRYNTDFFLGDVVQMQDNYGHFTSVQITEMTMSENIYQKTMYPTLKTV